MASDYYLTLYLQPDGTLTGTLLVYRERYSSYAHVGDGFEPEKPIAFADFAELRDYMMKRPGILVSIDDQPYKESLN